MQYVLLILGVFLLVGMYAIALYFNDKIPTPEECDVSLSCSSCHSTTCKYSTNNQINEIKKQIKYDIHYRKDESK